MILESIDPTESSAEVVSAVSTQMIDRARESVVQVRSRGRGASAGVIWNADNLVLTNHHVVAERRGSRKVQVALRDGQVFDAEVARCARSLDLALLRVKDVPGALPAAVVGDSNELRVGELVFAIGHPWGRLGAVTAGIVSGLEGARDLGERVRYIQSDVSLAPGNSGGPLLNARGEVVGINTMLFGSLALSIPSHTANTWWAGARERRPCLGVHILPVDLPELLRGGDQTGKVGFMVVALVRGGAADRAGLLVGDVLLGVADEPAGDAESLLDAITRVGTAARLRVARGGVILEIDVDLRGEGPGRAA